MIMGDSLGTDDDDEEDEDEDDDEDLFDNEEDDTLAKSQKKTKEKENVETKAPPSDTEAPSARPKRRRKGLASVFAKKNKNDREKDLFVLVGDGAKNPEFS